MVSQRGEEMIVGVTRADLPQQVDRVTDGLRLRGIQGPAQEVLRGAVLAFLPERVGEGLGRCEGSNFNRSLDHFSTAGRRHKYLMGYLCLIYLP